MNFYVIFTLLMVVLLFSKKRPSRSMGIFITIFLFFLSAFRGEKVGHDTANYTNLSYINQRAESSLTSLKDFSDFDTSIELISNFINKIVVLLGLNGQWVVIFYAFIMMVFMYQSCKRLKLNATYPLALFIVLGLFFFSLSACRQICAVSVIMYAMTFLKKDERRNKLFILWMLVATMIHSMSFICLPLYLIRILPSNLSYRKLGWIILVMSLLLTIVKIDFLNQMSVLAHSEHLSDYMSNYGENNSFSMISIVACWIETSCFSFYFFYKKKNDIDKSITTYDYIFLFSIILSAALLQYDGLVARVKYNFTIIQCFYLAYVFSNKRNKSFTFNCVTLIFLFLRVMKNYSFEVALESDYYFCF